MDDDFRRPYDELIASTFGGEASDNDYSLPLPEILYCVPGNIEMFQFGAEFISADEIIDMSSTVTFPKHIITDWEFTATEYMQLVAPEYIDDGDYVEMPKYIQEDFNSYEKGLSNSFGPFTNPTKTREMWESHNIVLLARSNPGLEHLVPDMTGNLSFDLSACSIHGFITYRKHPKLRAFYVKAIVE